MVAEDSKYSLTTVNFVIGAFWSLAQEEFKRGGTVRVPYTTMHLTVAVKQYPVLLGKRSRNIRGLWPHMEYKNPKFVEYTFRMKRSVWNLLKRWHREGLVKFIELI